MADANTSRETQLRFLHAALARISGRRLAIDGGANVGDWSDVLRQTFAQVFAIEPGEAFKQRLNVRSKEWPNVSVMPVALGEDSAAELLEWRPRNRTTSSSRFFMPVGVVPHKSELARERRIAVIAIDELRRDDVDLIKLDLEGAEMMALRGAVETIRKCRPAIIVEVSRLLHRHGDNEADIADFLRPLGYTRTMKTGVDELWQCT